ncbi:MAG: nitroreductase family deazaflavin-dependent oxidoreductase [Actinobacteria bacterium]|nr:nitroreductase family deazaflavin-dependent oxidoreductase [Actinomycetota bacterium]
MDDFNTKIIEEFRANDGVVGPPFEGAPMVLVHHKGAKTGTQRVTPLVYQPVGDDWAIFGSKGGAPDNPDWFHNLVANPDTEIEVGADTVPVSATVLSGDQRDEIWEKQKELMPGFAEYEKTAGDRVIPVVLLTRR